MIGPNAHDQALRGEHAAQVWTRLRERHLARVEVLERAVLALMDGELDEELRELAESEAHALAGTVGSFGLRSGTRLALALQQSFSARYTLGRQLAARLADQVMALRRELERRSVSPALSSEGAAPRRVLLASSGTRDDQYVSEGIAMALDIVPVPLAQGSEMVQLEVPDATIIEAGEHETAAVISLLEALAPRATGPVLVVSPHDTMALRLAIARAGATGPLRTGHPPSAVMERVVAALAAREATSASLLLVDSDPYALHAATLLLERAGHQVHALVDPSRFWETLETLSPDLVITGTAMTGVTGLDLCRALRADPRWRELPLILATTADEAPLARGAYQAGADDVVRKPFVADEVLARVENRLVRTRHLRRTGEADGLTGLPGRRKAEREIDRFLQLGRRHRHEVTLVTFRLDRYAEIVHRVGQAAVDAATLVVSQSLLRSFRSEDVVSQWAANEFVVALFDANAGNATVRVREVMEALRVRSFPAPDGAEFALTCSAGFATFPDDADDVRELYTAADAALLAATAGGETGAVGIAGDPNANPTGRVDVLLVDDDASVATLLMHALEARQFQVRWVRGGQDAAAALLGETPAVRARIVLLEVNLPELDGLALLRSLANQGVLRHTRVIVLSARSSEAETVQAFELGAFDYVAKPFSVAELVERIRRAVRA